MTANQRFESDNKYETHCINIIILTILFQSCAMYEIRYFMNFLKTKDLKEFL